MKRSMNSRGLKQRVALLRVLGEVLVEIAEKAGVSIGVAKESAACQSRYRALASS